MLCCINDKKLPCPRTHSRIWRPVPIETVGWPHLARQRRDTLCSDSVTKEIYGIHTENALGDIDDQPVLSQPLEEETQVTSVLLGVGADNKNIVDVHENELLEAATDFIHKSLERLCRILESKWHSEELEQAEKRYAVLHIMFDIPSGELRACDSQKLLKGGQIDLMEIGVLVSFSNLLPSDRLVEGG